MDDLRVAQDPSGDQDIERRRRFEGRAASDFEVPTAVLCGALAVAFGNIQGNGGAGPIKLFDRTEAAARKRSIEQFSSTLDELDRRLVNIEALVVESRHGVPPPLPHSCSCTCSCS